MRLLALSLVFSSFSAVACPDLAGKYAACRSTTGSGSNSHDMVITQSTRSGITTYTIKNIDDESNEPSEDTAIADGKPYSESADSDMGPVTYIGTATCEGDKLINDVKIEIDGAEVAAMVMKYSKSGKILKSEVKGHIFGIPSNDVIICE